MSATLLTTPAGWYHDPSNSGAWRWWDGGTWTAHVRQKEQTAPVAVVAAVPQPETAPAAQPTQPATLAPATRPSEQVYGRYVSAHDDRFWGEVGSPQTAGIWLLALLPIISFALVPVLGVVFGAITGPTGAIDNPVVTTQAAIAVYIGYLAVLAIAGWTFAGLDVKFLGARGYDPPKIWWMLVPLSPLAYFIARGKVVRAEGKRAWPPELLFFLSIILPIGLAVVGMIFAMPVIASIAGTAGIPL